MKKQLAAAVGITLCLSIVARAQNGASLLVLSKRDHTLAIVDATTLKVLARAPVGNDPHEVIASEDGATAYVQITALGPTTRLR